MGIGQIRIFYPGIALGCRGNLADEGQGHVILVGDQLVERHVPDEGAVVDVAIVLCRH